MLNSSYEHSSPEFLNSEMPCFMHQYTTRLTDMHCMVNFHREKNVKILLNSFIEETDAFEADIRELETNVTSAENVTSELSDLLKGVTENLTLAQEQLVTSETVLRVEIWMQLEMAMRLNRQLRRNVSVDCIRST